MSDYGKRAYYLGGSPVWQFFRVLFRMTRKPCIFGGLALGYGYFWAALTRMKRPVSDEMIRFHRKDQMMKLKTILGKVFRLKKVDSFTVATGQKESR